MKNTLSTLLVLILVVLGAGLFAVFKNKNIVQAPRPESDQVVCTMDAKICPDGSGVGRVGPKCEFAPCPTTVSSTTPISTTTPIVIRPSKIETGVEGIVTIGPTCPVQRYPADPNCADKPYQTTFVLSSTLPGRATGVMIKTDANGYFSDAIPPGTYTLRAQSTAVMPSFNPVTFTVVNHKLTSLNLQFDSGIR
jgi:hypothetical protein